MKSVIILGMIVFFLVVSGFHGLMWLLHGLTESYKKMAEGDSDKREFRDFMGKLFLLFLVGVGVHQVFWVEAPQLLNNIF
ncbi:hypothetical protein [Pseudoalteromonas sp. BDTF-M6]|uniref:hypothetical protein n=1 Tax=Pseudoalteromonas sp. BDTF-M6 TaxID=2796132 RepID=UPI001BB00849|nr:hypothetical protein [Pseudoalteromonas sp. BDTF-M6]MBS3797946.1 hypothetical protein [Pseudoalteromonas sp. BDTF-M6]